MKKLFVALMCVVMLCIVMLATPFSAYAEEYVDAGSGYYNSDIDIQCHAYSSFFITIPSSLSQNEYGALTVSYPNIEDGYHIAVYVTNLDENGYITVYDQNYDTNYREGRAMLYADGLPYVYSEDGLFCEFFEDDFDLNKATHTIAYDAAPNGLQHAGIYNGVISFRVECVPNE